MIFSRAILVKKLERSVVVGCFRNEQCGQVPKKLKSKVSHFLRMCFFTYEKKNWLIWWPMASSMVAIVRPEINRTFTDELLQADFILQHKRTAQFII